MASTDRLNVIAAIPYVWTRASQGVLQGMSGFQDITVAGKYSVLERPSTRVGALRAIGVVAVGIPLTGYSPDFQPLSIGLASKRVAGRFTLNLQSNPGWYLNGSAAYTWRGNVTLDRPYYYTNGQLFLTDEVTMPNVFDYIASAGYMKRGLMTTGSFSQQQTLGGGDIRRQDIPFVSNRMNFSRVGAMVMYPVPKLRNLAFQLAYGYTIDGRNVGQATTVTTGLLYRFPAYGRQLNENAGHTVRSVRRCRGRDFRHHDYRGQLQAACPTGGLEQRRRRRHVADDRLERANAIHGGGSFAGCGVSTIKRSWRRSRARSRDSRATSAS